MKKVPRQDRLHAKDTTLDHPWDVADPIPRPAAVELSHESGWQAWQTAVDSDAASYAPTVPAPLTMPDPLSAPASTYPPTQAADLVSIPRIPAQTVRVADPHRREVSVERLIAIARQQNRACPTQVRWNALYLLLRSRMPGDGSDPLTPPPQGTAWRATTALSKRLALRDHIEWAGRNGCLAAMHDFLGSLGPGDWEYLGGWESA